MAEVKAKKRKWPWVIGGILILLIIIGKLGEDGTETSSATSSTEVAETTKEPVEVTSRQLAEDFDENEVAAKAKYDKAVLVVTGTVQSITLDLMDDPVVLLDGINPFSNVHVSFNKSHVEQTAALKKGQKLTVTCKKIGEAIGSPMLSRCEIE